MLEIEKAVTEEQQIVLTELLQSNNFWWTIMSKRHTYTDGNNSKVHTDGLIIVVKKPFLRKARGIFALIRVRYPNCLGVVCRYWQQELVISTGMKDTEQ